MSNWLKEPLLHFLVLGALVFVLYGFIGPDAPSDDEIVVSRGQQEHLVTAFTRTWQRPPTQVEFTNIVDDWINEEIAYREGLSMGLDTDDTIIRRRLRQKLEILAEDIVSLAEPTEEMLQEYLEQNIATYTAEPVYTLRQIYFNADTRGAQAEQDAEQALLLLATDAGLTNPENLGDRLSIPYRYVQKREGGTRRYARSCFCRRPARPRTRHVAGPDPLRLRAAPRFHRGLQPGPAADARGSPS